MKKILNYILIGAFISFAYNCEEDDSAGSNYVTLESSPIGFSVGKDATETKDVNVYTGNVTGSDRTFSVAVDASSTLGTSYTVPATVTIPGGTNVGTLAVSVTDDDTLEFVAQTLVLSIEDEAGISVGGNLVVNVTELCPANIVTFKLNLDTWPDETTWELYDLSNGSVVIASGGPYINPDDDFAALSFDFCLQAGDYGIVVYDSYGDGGPDYTVSVGSTTLASGSLSSTFSSSTFTL